MEEFNMLQITCRCTCGLYSNVNYNAFYNKETVINISQYTCHGKITTRIIHCAVCNCVESFKFDNIYLHFKHFLLNMHAKYLVLWHSIRSKCLSDSARLHTINRS